MKGALVFLASFIVFVAITLIYPVLPPGVQIYGLLGIAESTYPVLGIPITTLACAIFNGVIYGIIIWLIYSLIFRDKKSVNEPQTEQ